MEKVIDPELDRKIANEPKNIPGWGMDADPDNDPTYPMKHRDGSDYQRIHYERAPQQEQKIEIFHSIERPGITRVFGTSTPPTGLSGSVRRFAYKYSEATAAHWMSLILADRINVVEGIVEDIKNGKFPNLVQEFGWAAEWKYNRKKFITRMAVKAAVMTLVTLYLTRKKK